MQKLFLPALEKADEAVRSLQKSDIDELKIINNPTDSVKRAMECCLLILDEDKGKKNEWQLAQQKL